MGRRHELNKFAVYSAADSTTDPVSEITDISSLDKILYQLDVAAGVIGELKVQICNDKLLTNLSSFVDLDFNATLTINGSTDTDYMVEIENKGFKWMKLSFTDNSGTGNISGWITGTSAGA